MSKIVDKVLKKEKKVEVEAVVYESHNDYDPA